MALSLLNIRCHGVLTSPKFFRCYRFATVRLFPEYAPEYPKRTFADAVSPKLMFTFACPHVTICKNKEIQSVNVPGVSGEMGILAQHVPTIAELKPGVVSIKAEKEEKYFISGGFAFIHKDSTCTVSSIEAVPLDQIDPHLAESGYKKYSEELSKSTNDQDRAKAMIGMEVHLAMIHALGLKA
jgi:F-type H+-transporting ATPase subunit delta